MDVERQKCSVLAFLLALQHKAGWRDRAKPCPLSATGKLGLSYLVANGLLVVLLTPANYILGHWWTFASGRPRRDGQLHEERSLQLEYH
jgi:hypothetical protein